MFYQLRREHSQWHSWMQEHPIVIDLSSIAPDADGCPKCESTTIKYRARTGTWVCSCKAGGVNCGEEFTTPIRVVSHRTLRDLTKIARQKSQAAFEDKFGIGRQVTILAIEEHLRYMSLEDTKTLCKRCAFVEDKTGMLLRGICSKRYHSKCYDRCSTCAGVDTSESRGIF